MNLTTAHQQKNVHQLKKHIIVETRNGPVRGVLKNTILKDVPYYSFKGIPYAKPPIGSLRFKVNQCYFSIKN